MGIQRIWKSNSCCELLLKRQIKTIIFLMVLVSTAATNVSAQQMCSGDPDKKAVVVSYIDQLTEINIDDIVQRAYIENKEIRTFVKVQAFDLSRSSASCRPLLNSLRSALKELDGSLDGYSESRACDPQTVSRVCWVVGTNKGLNLRVLPGVVNDLTRREGFTEGSKISGTCAFGSWIHVSGTTSDGDYRYGWSHRNFLRCSPNIEESAAKWKG